MPGARAALLVVNSEYDDAGLRQLQAPGADAAALAEVLADRSVGAFDVRVLPDETTQVVRTAIEEFFADRAPDDLLLLHFSCHGVKSGDGRLFLAQRDTKPKRLASTGLAAEFINEQMAGSRAQRIALFLDCCYGGAFSRGLVGRAGEDAHVGEQFLDIEDESSGRGRVVITASSAMQYSFEAGSLAAHEEQPSLFTGALVEALTTGEADRDGDGWVGLTELFTFVRNQVRRAAPEQTPQMWTYGASGEILLARSKVRRIVAADLDPEVVTALGSPLPSTRLGQVDLLREWALGTDLPVALAAWQALDKLTRDDSEKVRSAVARVRAEAALSVTPQTLQMNSGSAETVLSLGGPPLARAITVTADSPALTMEYDDQLIRVATTGSVGEGQQALLTVTSPTGSVDVTVVVTEATVEETSSVAVDVSPAHTATPVATPVAEETAVFPLVPVDEPVDTRRRRRALLILAPVLLIVAAVGVVAWALNRGWGDDAAVLPQGSRLPDEVMVWVASSVEGDTIVSGPRGGPERVLVPPVDGKLLYPAISPDRRTIVAVVQTSRVRRDLWVVGSDGTDARAIDSSDNCVFRGRPSWSPDGEEIATICFAEDGLRLGVGIVAWDGSARMLTVERQAMTPDWSSKGEVVYASSESATDAGAPSTLWAVPEDGGRPRQLTEGSRDLYPAVDPAGQWVAFTRIKDGTGSLFKRHLGSGREEQLTFPRQGEDLMPAWSPRGETIVFQRGPLVFEVSASGATPDHPSTPVFGLDGAGRHMLAWH